MQELRTLPGWIKHKREKPLIEFETSDLKVFWNEAIKKTEKNLLESLCIWISKIVYYRKNVLSAVTLFGKTAGIKRFERMVGKAKYAFGERNSTNNEENQKEILKTLYRRNIKTAD